ncbi:MAG: chorismate mutase [Deltaproteobacteria bacterium]|nr:chorismate mutase [Deltaproteobacteria bacterium]
MSEQREGIAELRASFDAIDSELLRLVAARRAVSRRMAAVKLAEGLPFHDPAREAELLARLRAECTALGLPDTLVEQLFLLLLADSLQVQRQDEPTAT